MALVGHQFTWERRRDTDDMMEVRLDRALTNMACLNLFPLEKLYNLEGTSSDHNPILLVPQIVAHIHAPYRFKFENAWMLGPMCEVLIQDAWNSNSEALVIQKNKSCSQCLARWGKEITGNFNTRIKRYKMEMKQFRGGKDARSKERYREARNELSKVLNQREIFWRQRSKQLWLSAGDQNGKFFHSYDSNRRRNNRINKLKNVEGQWMEWENGLNNLMSGYFSELFTAKEVDWQEVISYIPTTVSREHNEFLLQPITEKEVKEALFQMNPDKALGPDGMTPGFYQNYWKTVGQDVINLVHNFFSSRTIIDDLNATNIVLIPKKKCPVVVGDLRSISLCNVLMKIVTKVIANRLKGTLDQVILENKSAFMSDV